MFNVNLKKRDSLCWIENVSVRLLTKRKSTLSVLLYGWEYSKTNISPLSVTCFIACRFQWTLWRIPCVYMIYQEDAYIITKQDVRKSILSAFACTQTFSKIHIKVLFFIFYYDAAFYFFEQITWTACCVLLLCSVQTITQLLMTQFGRELRPLRWRGLPNKTGRTEMDFVFCQYMILEEGFYVM